MNKTKVINPQAVKIIDALDGTAEVSRLCDISMPAVSQWRINGIPKAQLKFLKLAKPKVFKKLAELV